LLLFHFWILNQKLFLSFIIRGICLFFLRLLISYKEKSNIFASYLRKYATFGTSYSIIIDNDGIFNTVMSSYKQLERERERECVCVCVCIMYSIFHASRKRQAKDSDVLIHEQCCNIWITNARCTQFGWEVSSRRDLFANKDIPILRLYINVHCGSQLCL